MSDSELYQECSWHLTVALLDMQEKLGLPKDGSDSKELKALNKLQTEVRDKNARQLFKHLKEQLCATK